MAIVHCQFPVLVSASQLKFAQSESNYYYAEMRSSTPKVSQTRGPQPFWHQGPVLWKTVFTWTGDEGGGAFRMVRVHHIYCALHFISITITSVPSQIIRHYVLEAGDPCPRQHHSSQDNFVPGLSQMKSFFFADHSFPSSPLLIISPLLCPQARWAIKQTRQS